MTANANEQSRVDMLDARGAASIGTTSIRSFIHGGVRNWNARKSLLDVVSNDPIFDKSQRQSLKRSERYKRSLRIMSRLQTLRGIHKWTPDELRIVTSLFDDQLPIHLHLIAFEPVFNSQASSTLREKYSHLISSWAILGCYLQTELGHGTNLSRLETTATYLPQSEEFEIHSPTLTSSKWWIGGLGKTATHGVVQAKLILPGGRDMGPHLFFMQLRSLDDHKPLRGINMGDIGPKVLGGYQGLDNGYARFDHVRIPRENMLSKFAKVTVDGKYVSPPHAKLSYGGMLYIRANMVTGSGFSLAKAATVAIRYGTVRRQGSSSMLSQLEPQTISYPSVHCRILPILARAYVFIKLGQQLASDFSSLSAQLQTGDMSQLPAMHATTAALKVLSSTITVQDIETARRSMGGHGYSGASGLGETYTNNLPSVTYEGDNFVLDEQVVRAAVKACRALLSSSSPPSSLVSSTTSPFSHYLAHVSAAPPVMANSQEPWTSYKTLITLLELRAACIVRSHTLSLISAEERKERQHDLGDDPSVNQRISRAVAEAYVAGRVGEMISQVQTDQSLGRQDKEVLSKVFLLYLLTTVESGLVDLLSFSLLLVARSAEEQGRNTVEDPTRGLRLAIGNLCKEILPEAIGLSDAFGFTDWELDSALGVENGKVYEALWDFSQREPLNRKEVTGGYETYLKPMMEGGRRLATTAKL